MAGDPTWSLLDKDLEVLAVALPNTVLPAEVVFLRSSLTHLRPAVIQARDFGLERAGVHTLCKRARALACLNANFFDEQGRALGLLISRGVPLQRIHTGGNTLTGIFEVRRNQVRISHRSEFKSEAVIEAVQAGPRLLIGGKATEVRDNSTTKRSGVCIDKKGRLILFAGPSWLSGISLTELQATLLRPELGCVEALNFDGGGSTQLYVGSDSAHTLSFSGQDNVPVALGLFKIG